MEEIKKHLMRVVTGEIIEFEKVEETHQDRDVVILHGARFSHPVTFGGVDWKPSTNMAIKKNHIVYVLEQEA